MAVRVTVAGHGFASIFFLMSFLEQRFYPHGMRRGRVKAPATDITVIGDGRFVYFPGLPRLLVGSRGIPDLVADVRPFFARRGIHFVEARVTAVTRGGRTVMTDHGPIENDALFLGTGPTYRKDALPGTSDHTYSPCESPERLAAFAQRLAGLSRGIIYVGFRINRGDGFVAGRTGPLYECACLIDAALRQRGVRDDFEIHFFSADRPPGERGVLTDRLRERGIILHDGYAPSAFTAGGLLDADGGMRPADLVLYSAEMTGPAWLAQSCLPVSPGGHLAVDRYGAIPGLERAFAAGDCAAHDNPPPWVPHQAHMAQLRAQAAARNLRDVLSGKTPTARYRHELSCILDMQNDALWMHRSEDGQPPFHGVFPKHSRRLISLKTAFEKLFLFYLRHL